MGLLICGGGRNDGHRTRRGSGTPPDSVACGECASTGTGSSPSYPCRTCPTLGPVHPGDPLPALLTAVVENAGTGRFLPHDKDRRWADRKQERVLVDAVEHGQRQTLVPTLLESGPGTVRVHVYGTAPDSWPLAPTSPASSPPTTAPTEPASSRSSPPASPTRTSRGPASSSRTSPPAPAPRPTSRCRSTSSSPTPRGSPTSRNRWRPTASRSSTAGCWPGQSARSSASSTGTTGGPMETMPGAAGRLRLLPQYFGVLPTHRGLGYGRALCGAQQCTGATATAPPTSCCRPR